MATSTAAPASTPVRPGVTARSGSRRWVGITIMTIIGTVAILLIGFVGTFIFGNVLGTEFCPHTFERRGFAFREIPFVGIQVTGINRATDTGVVELHIIAKGYIVPDPTEPKTWHLLKLIRFRGTYATGDAALLMKYLDAQDEEKNYAWLEWSEQHPKLAKVLWPAVAKAAQDGDYLIVPDLFSDARSTNDSVELQKRVDAILAKSAAAKSESGAAETEKGAAEKKEPAAAKP